MTAPVCREPRDCSTCGWAPDGACKNLESCVGFSQWTLRRLRDVKINDTSGGPIDETPLKYLGMPVVVDPSLEGTAIKAVLIDTNIPLTSGDSICTKRASIEVDGQAMALGQAVMEAGFMPAPDEDSYLPALQRALASLKRALADRDQMDLDLVTTRSEVARLRATIDVLNSDNAKLLDQQRRIMAWLGAGLSVPPGTVTEQVAWLMGRLR